MERWTAKQYRDYLNSIESTGNKKGRFPVAPKDKRTFTGKWRGVQQTIVFASKGEYERFNELRLLERTGSISELSLQPSFEIIPENKKAGERKAKYTADFQYIENGHIIVEEVKSKITAKLPDYINRRKSFKQQYPELIHREVIR